MLGYVAAIMKVSLSHNAIHEGPRAGDAASTHAGVGGAGKSFETIMLKFCGAAAWAALGQQLGRIRAGRRETDDRLPAIFAAVKGAVHKWQSRSNGYEKQHAPL
jgi:hypothetical protein